MLIGKELISDWFRDLQDRISLGLELADEKGSFKEDNWIREAGGGGRTRILQNGNVIEKGGVNFSAVFGKAPEFLIDQLKADNNAEFFATGISIVIHPNNPHIPIIHMNVRYFEMSGGIAWFGGGIDLTPHYVKQEDGNYFHSNLKKACDKYSRDYYGEFKKWADNYFYIKHRKETRGIGGIFFDQLKANDEFTLEDRWNFVKEIGDSFLPIYTELIKRNCSSEFTEAEKQWQLLRRGRYVEFNLVYDRGTKFGLDTDGRTESILMSLPNLAAWEYNFIPTIDSPEQQTLNFLKKDIDWVK